MIRFVAALYRRSCRHARRRPRPIRSGQARRLSGQRHPHLRQLPFAERPAGRRPRQAVLRRPVVGRAAVQGDRVQHHAGQGNRHRQVERRRHQEADAYRHAAERRAHRDGDADRLLPHHDRARSERGRRLSAHDQADQQQGRRSDLQDAAGRERFSGRREAVHRSDDEGQGEEGLLPRHHRPLHGVPHADGEGAASLGPNGRRRL